MENTDSQIFVIAQKLHAKENPLLGFVKPLFREINGEYVALNSENFCQSGRVFITSGYDEIENKYKSHELFKIEVFKDENHAPVASYNPSQYVASGRKTERLRPRDLVEIVNAELPDPNSRFLSEEVSVPGTKYIFVKNQNNAAFGPLEWEITSVEDRQIHISVPTSQLPGPKLQQGQIYELSAEKVIPPKVLVTDDGRMFIRDLQEVLIGSSFYDYSSDEDIIHFCAKYAATFKASTISKQQLQVLNAQAKGPTVQPLTKARWERFCKINSELIQKQSDAVQFMAEFLNGEAGNNIVQTYVNNNETKFLESIKISRKSEIEKSTLLIEEERKTATDRLREINQQKKDASVELERLKEEQEKSKTFVPLAQVSAEADANLLEKYAELEKVKSDIAEKSLLIGGMTSLLELDGRKNRINVELELLREQSASIKTSTKELRKEFNGEEEEIRNKILKIKPLIDAINGSFVSDLIEFPKISVIPAINDGDKRGLAFQKDVVSTIEAALKKEGRNVQSWEVVNLLINTQQSFITFLSGLPGAGKTSICRMLAETQGLNNRFNEISVARGWTTLKDIVGFYNPLSNRFQPSNTGLFQFLSSLHAESELNADAPMAYVLLDEANLSPIEHYWSSFMAMTDGSGIKKLSLGQESLIIPNNLRFIATINYDGTTEPLSPRVVDRSPIIVMETARTREDFDIVSDRCANLPLSSVTMEDLFGNNVKTVPQFENSEEKIFLAICNALADPSAEKGRPINISTRKEYAIRQYCGKARSIMLEDSDLAAFDLAVLQHVLPLVRGSGSKFAKRLDDLKKVLKDKELPRSEAYLERMVSYGASELHSYDFFCW